MLTEPLWSEPSGADAGLFRPVHYLGNKFKLRAEISRAVFDVAPAGSRVADVFAGTGVIAGLLSRSGHLVTAGDIQTYSRILTTALMSGPLDVRRRYDDVAIRFRQQHAEGLTDELAVLFELESRAIARFVERGDPRLLCALVDYGSLTYPDRRALERHSLVDIELPVLSATATLPNRALLLSHYGGLYFSYRQAYDLDCLTAAIGHGPGRSNNTMRAALLSTASDVVSAVGNQFAQPLRPTYADGTPKPTAAAQLTRQWSKSIAPVFESWCERYASLSPVYGAHRFVLGDFGDLLDGHLSDCAAVYADPPYTRDHYSRFYHVLETIARGDTPPLASVSGSSPVSRGLYRVDRHQSPFCIRSTAASAFRLLFTRVAQHQLPLVLSYSASEQGDGHHPRTITLSELTSLAKQAFRRVEIRSVVGSTHSRLNAASLAKPHVREHAELLIVCTH